MPVALKLSQHHAEHLPWGALFDLGIFQDTPQTSVLAGYITRLRKRQAQLTTAAALVGLERYEAGRAQRNG